MREISDLKVCLMTVVTETPYGLDHMYIDFVCSMLNERVLLLLQNGKQ
jgi:hypothetical protein